MRIQTRSESSQKVGKATAVNLSEAVRRESEGESLRLRVLNNEKESRCPVTDTESKAREWHL